MILIIIGLTAQDRVTLEIFLHFANADVDGTIEVQEVFLGGVTGDIWEWDYSEGTTEIQLTNDYPNNQYLYVHQDTEYLTLIVTSNGQGLISDPIYLNLPSVTFYEKYLVFYRSNYMRPVDMDYGGGIDMMYDGYFTFSGCFTVQYPGPDGGSPEEYGIRLKVANNGQIEYIPVYYGETWGNQYEYNIEYSEEFEFDNLFFESGSNSLLIEKIAPNGYSQYIYGGGCDYDYVTITFEYVPDMSNKSISVTSFNTTGDEWHPKISWNGLNDFPSSWVNHFHVGIWRKIVPLVGPIENWEIIGSIRPNVNEFIDYDITTPDDDLGTKFGIEGHAHYKVILTQDLGNPNYSICPSIPNNEEWANTFLFSLEDHIMYGTQGSVGIGSTKGSNDIFIENLRIRNNVISFNITDNGFVNTEINLYNIKGQHIRSIFNDNLNKGQHSIKWNGLDKYSKRISNGIYLFQLKRGNCEILSKLVLLN